MVNLDQFTSEEQMQLLQMLDAEEVSQPAQPAQPSWYDTIMQEVPEKVTFDPAAAVIGAGQGVSAGFNDEILAAIEAGALSLADVDPNMSLADFYKMARDKNRQGINEARTRSPGSFFAGEVAGGAPVPVGALGKATTFGSKMAASSVLGAFNAAGRSEADNPIDLAIDTGIGTVFGAGLGGGFHLGGKVVGYGGKGARQAGAKIKSLFEREAPEVTLNISKTSGIGADDIQNATKGLDDDAANLFKRALKMGYSDDQAAALAKAKQYGVRMSIGDVSQDFGEQSLEQGALKGVYGEKSQAIARQFRDAQSDDLARASGALGRKLGGKELSTQDDYADAIFSKLKSLHATDKSKAVKGVRKAVQRSGTKAYVPREEIGNFAKAARTTLQDEFELDLAPAAKTFLNKLDKVANNQNSKGMTLYSMEQMRRQMSKVRPPDPSFDAVKSLKNILDDYQDELLTSNLIKGDSAALKDIMNARSAYARYKNKYYGQGKSKKVIGKWLEKDESPENIVNELFSISKLGGRKESVKALKELKNVLGENSDEFATLRQSAFIHRMLGDKNTKLLLSGEPSDIAGQFSGTQLANNVKELLVKNKTFADELFTPAQQKEIRDFALDVAARANKTQEGIVNYSNSGNMIARHVNQLLNKMGNTPIAGRPVRMLQGGFEAANEATQNANVQQQLTRSFSDKLQPILQKTQDIDDSFTQGLGSKLGGIIAGKSIPDRADSLQTQTPTQAQEIDIDALTPEEALELFNQL